MENYTFTYPLEWPAEYARTKDRISSRFKVTPGQARDEMVNELNRMGAHYIAISSNLQLGKQGKPLTQQRDPQDPGISVFFHVGTTSYVMACDKYDDVFDNMRAIGLTIQALRTIERHGSTDLMQKAFQGFKALPQQATAPTKQPWWEVLNFQSPTVSVNEVKAQYRRLSKQYHPDGSEPNESHFRTVHEAYLEALKDVDS